MHDRATFRRYALASILVLAGCGSGDEVPPEARLLHDGLLTIDSHDDIPPDFASPSVDPLDADRQVNLEKMLAGGLDAGFFIVYVAQTERTPENYLRAQSDALIKFDAIHRMTEWYPQIIGLAATPDELETIVGGGRLAAVIGIENGYVIGTDLALLADYYAWGARYMTLAHNGHNDIADSATPRRDLGDMQSEHEGISEFGAAVIAEMNRLGMLIDVSHVSKAAALEAIALSRAPVIASHSSVRALADHPRNLDDETLRALAAAGGIVQIVALDDFVKVQPPERQAALRDLRTEFGLVDDDDADLIDPDRLPTYTQALAAIERRWPAATVADFVDHIDYAVELIGMDHVGIASDFDGGGGVVGWNGADETPNVTRELLRRGYEREEIEKLWGGNLLRVWRAAEAVAAERF